MEPIKQEVVEKVFFQMQKHRGDKYTIHALIKTNKYTDGYYVQINNTSDFVKRELQSKCGIKPGDFVALCEEYKFYVFIEGRAKAIKFKQSLEALMVLGRFE